MCDQKREYPRDSDRHPGMMKLLFLLRNEATEKFNTSSVKIDKVERRYDRSIRTCIKYTPEMTVKVTTKTLPKNSTKSPTLLIAATRRMLLDRAWKAFLPPVQKLHPYMAGYTQYIVIHKHQDHEERIKFISVYFVPRYILSLARETREYSTKRPESPTQDMSRSPVSI